MLCAVHRSLRRGAAHPLGIFVAISSMTIPTKVLLSYYLIDATAVPSKKFFSPLLLSFYESGRCARPCVTRAFQGSAAPVVDVLTTRLSSTDPHFLPHKRLFALSLSTASVNV